VKPVHKVCQEMMVLRAQPVHRASKDYREFKAKPAYKEFRVK
jgi:hypothetical protein